MTSILRKASLAALAGAAFAAPVATASGIVDVFNEQKGNRRAAVHFSPDANTVFQIGRSLYATELEGPDENGR